MHPLTTTQGLVALGAGAIAVVALLTCLALWLSLRRVRGAQRAVLGEGGQRDLVDHAATLEQAFLALRDHVDDLATHVDGRLTALEAGLELAVSRRSLVRYDAYNEMSGRQSLSVALLDATRSGIVLSSIHHRDQARLYATQIHSGRPEHDLSPEEEEAVRLAVAGEAQPSAR